MTGVSEFPFIEPVAEILDQLDGHRQHQGPVEDCAYFRWPNSCRVIQVSLVLWGDKSGLLGIKNGSFLAKSP